MSSRKTDDSLYEAIKSSSSAGQIRHDDQNIYARAAWSELGGQEIADNQGMVAPKKRQRARTVVVARSTSPAVAEIGSGDASGDEDATTAMDTILALPPVANFEAGAEICMAPTDDLPPSSIPSGGQLGVDYPVPDATSEAGAIVPPSPTILALVALRKQRVFCIKSQSRCDRSCEAFIASCLGYAAPREKDTERAGEKARKELFARAASMRKAVEKGGHYGTDNHRLSAPEADEGGQRGFVDQGSDALFVCTPIIVNSAQARSAWDELRKNTEKQMLRLVRQLPVYEWANGISGFGDLGLAIIVGETGELANYATKERVWKRLGLAVIDGERQQKRTDKDAAAKHGYNPRRRAEIWTIADSMFKHQWHGAKEDIPAGPTGPYGEVYRLRREHTAERDWSDGRKNNDARRVMCKALIEDLWRVWNGKLPLGGHGLVPDADGEGHGCIDDHNVVAPSVRTPIGSAAKPARRQRATKFMATDVRVPAVANSGV